MEMKCQHVGCQETGEWRHDGSGQDGDVEPGALEPSFERRVAPSSVEAIQVAVDEGRASSRWGRVRLGTMPWARQRLHLAP